VVVVTSTGHGLVQEVTVGPHRLESDEPKSAGGFDQGPDPYALLLASLGSCTAMTLQLYARHKAMPLEGIRVHLRHAKVHSQDCAECVDKPVLLDWIERRIELSGKLSAEQRAVLLGIANKCPVHRTLTSQIKIDTSLAE
jgi:uncharacterized OsmC-like protein